MQPRIQSWKTCSWHIQDSVPAALTKDKKRIDGQEVAVHLAWQSTLYVTNFPEKADDTFIRTLFAKVRVRGLVRRTSLQSYIPSMGRSSTYGGQARSSRQHGASATSSLRLRCVFFYTLLRSRLHEMPRQLSAQAALELHGTQIEPDMSLNVYISNPERKKERTDADANDREIYVAGALNFD